MLQYHHDIPSTYDISISYVYAKQERLMYMKIYLVNLVIQKIYIYVQICILLPALDKILQMDTF